MLHSIFVRAMHVFLSETFFFFNFFTSFLKMNSTCFNIAINSIRYSVGSDFDPFGQQHARPYSSSLRYLKLLNLRPLLSRRCHHLLFEPLSWLNFQISMNQLLHCGRIEPSQCCLQWTQTDLRGMDCHDWISKTKRLQESSQISKYQFLALNFFCQ